MTEHTTTFRDTSEMIEGEGKLIKVIKGHSLNISESETIVFDEAHYMVRHITHYPLDSLTIVEVSRYL